MANDMAAIREFLVRALSWQESHVGFDAAVDGIPADRRGAHAAGFEHSPWQLVEHLRIAQEDILEFCNNAGYTHDRKWPDDYWPTQPAPADDAAWTASIAAYRTSLEGIKRLAREVADLTATVPTGKGSQTYLRAILLVIDHNAYHVGQIVAVRKALGIWK